MSDENKTTEPPDLEQAMADAEREDRRVREERAAFLRACNERALAAQQALGQVQADLTNAAVDAAPTAAAGFLAWLDRNRAPLLIGAGGYASLVALELVAHKLRQIRQGRAQAYRGEE